MEGSVSGLPRPQLPEAAVRSRPGVRGRLLLAFFGISAFAILGAGAALYSFREIDGSLGLITQRRIPVVVQSQELSRHAERITAAAPALLRLLQEARQCFARTFVRRERTIRYCQMRGRLTLGYFPAQS